MTAKTYDYVFTGGGSGGHVVPALTLIDALGKEVLYIGSYEGIEKRLTENKTHITYKAIQTGKLRRYASWQNFTDLFKILIGIFQSFHIIFQSTHRKTLIIATGGFVGVPVVFASWLLRRRIFLHEQTSRAGLANRIMSIFCQKIFLSFQASAIYFPENKTKVTGYPLRPECLTTTLSHNLVQGVNLEETLATNIPILLVTGGGNGSKLINELVKSHFDYLIKHFIIFHQVGNLFLNEFQTFKGQLPSDQKNRYMPFAFESSMIDLMKISTIIVSRAGAGTVCELMALKKKVLFIPLKGAQNNEQYYNAKEAQEGLFCEIIEENDLNSLSFLNAIKILIEERSTESKTLSIQHKRSTEIITQELLRASDI